MEENELKYSKWLQIQCSLLPEIHAQFSDWSYLISYNLSYFVEIQNLLLRGIFFVIMTITTTTSTLFVAEG